MIKYRQSVIRKKNLLAKPLESIVLIPSVFGSMAWCVPQLVVVGHIWGLRSMVWRTPQLVVVGHVWD